MAKIIPGVLTNDPSELSALLKEAAGVGDRVQIDIIDGKFVDNRTIDPFLLTTVETNLKIDFHLMVEEPIKWLAKCSNALGDRVFGQIEMMEDQVAFVQEAQEWGMAGGIAVDLDTQLEAIEGEIFPMVDSVLLMSVPAGFAGQTFDTSVYDKIKRLKGIQLREKTNFNITVDGGVTPGILKDLVDMGVDEVVVGQRIFRGNSAEKIEKYLEVSEE
jgi:ribulose-phosphate 3-epimerase